MTVFNPCQLLQKERSKKSTRCCYLPVKILRTLLKKDNVFIWESNEQRAFEEIKALISNLPLLKYFNPNERVEVQVDAPSSGLEGCLIQHALRALTETEECYSQTEKEMLSIAYCLARFHTYTYGGKVTIYSKHKLLDTALKKPVADSPSRRCIIMGYDLEFK